MRWRKAKPGRDVRQGLQPGQSPVFSYYNNRPADIVSPVKRTKNRQAIDHTQTPGQGIVYYLRHIPSYIAVTIIVLSLLYSITLETTPKIVLSKPTQNSLLQDPLVYQQAIAKLLNRSQFNKTKLTINTESIERQIEQQFPELQMATISLPMIGRKPVIGLDAAQPTLILSTSSGDFIIGQDGRALINVAKLGSRTPSLPTVKDDNGLMVEQGKIAMTKESVAFITTVVFQLQQKGIIVQTIQLPPIVNELRLTPQNQPYYIKFDLGSDALQQAGTFLAVKERLDDQKITPSEYVDVRVNERAYYK